MKSNSHSLSSSSQDNKFSMEYKNRKRARKRIQKGQDGSRFENMDSLQNNYLYQGYDSNEEIKSPVKDSHNRFQFKKNNFGDTGLYNRFTSDKSTQKMVKRKSRMEIISDEEENYRSDSDIRFRHNKVKVKKIDDEEVGLDSFSDFILNKIFNF